MRRLTAFVWALLACVLVGTSSFSAEIGENDFRITVSGPEGDTNFSPFIHSVAYNPVDDEYLVVWSGTDDADPVLNEFEVLAQRLEGATGALVGPAFRVSDMGPDGDANFFGGIPDVVYNSTHHEYLIVWVGDDDTGALVDEEYEVYGQRLNAATGEEVGENDFRISQMGPDGDPFFGIGPFFPPQVAPDVAYNPTHDEYLVVWSGEDDTAPLVINEQEIFGQRLAGDDAAALGDDFRISRAGPDGDMLFFASNPKVVYNGIDDHYFVVWHGQGTFQFDITVEIFGQRLNAATGDLIAPSPIQISDMGPGFDPDFRGVLPAVAHNPVDNEYLVVWEGDDDTEPLIDGETEIFGQRLKAATGEHVGPNDFRVSAMGPDGSKSFDAGAPDLMYHPTNHEYLIVWAGDDDASPLVDDEFEIYIRRLEASTGEPLDDQTKISDAGLDGFPQFGATTPSIAFSPLRNEYLVTWEADETVDFDSEIFGQLLAKAACGNGVVEEGEECDDGNTEDGDGCSAACASEDGAATAGSGDSGGGCSLTSR